MPKHSNDRLQGTLDLLVLRILANAPAPLHGYGIAQKIHALTRDGLRIEEGSLYPALHRMANEKWLRAQWGVTEINRRARFYSITVAGRRQLDEEQQRWAQLTQAVDRVLQLA